MFGYLKPDYPYLFLKDDTLYKSLYCGICKSIGERLGCFARLSLTYDSAFMSAVCHNVMGVDVTVQKKHCVTHIIRHTPVAKPDEISFMLADLNLILAKYKVFDDILDEKKGKIKNAVIAKGYKIAKKNQPELDKIVKIAYENLRKLEKSQCDSIDVVADSFATMLQNVSREVLKTFSNEYTDTLFYAVGKWIYLIDALDDYDKDVKSKNYNVLYFAYKSANYSELLKQNGESIAYIFNGIFMQIAETFPKIKTYFDNSLIANVLLRGIPATTKKIINKREKENG